jgi:hypothetical protein
VDGCVWVCVCVGAWVSGCVWYVCVFVCVCVCYKEQPKDDLQK